MALKTDLQDYFCKSLYFCWLSPGQTDSQVVASWKIGSTCDSVCPGLACNCVDLRWLAISLVQIKFARNSMQVFYRLATQAKSLRKFNLPLLATTCESFWPGLYIITAADLSSSIEILLSVDSFSFPASFFPATPPKTFVQISLYFLRYFVFLKQ